MLAELIPGAVEIASISARLKGADRIIQKLRRIQTIELDRMDDVAGCRVIVGTSKDLRVVTTALRSRWSSENAEAVEVLYEKDYTAAPKQTGYRAVHITVRQSGLRVEVQFRTERQHAWAALVERLEDRHGVLFRDGEGHPNIRQYLRLLAEALAAMESGQPVPVAVRRELFRLRGDVRGL